METDGPPGHPVGGSRPRVPPRGVAARLVAVQRGARRDDRPAVLVRVPLRAAVPGRRVRALPLGVPARRSSSPSRTRWSRCPCCARRTQTRRSGSPDRRRSRSCSSAAASSDRCRRPRRRRRTSTRRRRPRSSRRRPRRISSGSPRPCIEGLLELQRRTGADEIMLSTARTRRRAAGRSRSSRAVGMGPPEPGTRCAEPRFRTARVPPDDGGGARSLSQPLPRFFSERRAVGRPTAG